MEDIYQLVGAPGELTDSIPGRGWVLTPWYYGVGVLVEKFEGVVTLKTGLGVDLADWVPELANELNEELPSKTTLFGQLGCLNDDLTVSGISIPSVSTVRTFQVFACLPEASLLLQKKFGTPTLILQDIYEYNGVQVSELGFNARRSFLEECCPRSVRLSPFYTDIAHFSDVTSLLLEEGVPSLTFKSVAFGLSKKSLSYTEKSHFYVFVDGFSKKTEERQLKRKPLLNYVTLSVFQGEKRVRVGKLYPSREDQAYWDTVRSNWSTLDRKYPRVLSVVGRTSPVPFGSLLKLKSVRLVEPRYDLDAHKVCTSSQFTD